MIYIIANPIAGRNRAVKKAAQISRLFAKKDIPCGVYETLFPGHAREITQRAVTDGASAVFCVGGDGTAHEIIEVLAQTDIRFGLIPAGSGNDFARSLKNCSDVNHIKLAERYLAGQTYKIDLIRVTTPLGGYFCANAASLGLDAEIVFNAALYKKRFGGGAYVVSTITTVPSYKPKTLSLDFGDKKTDGAFTLTALCNGQVYGGGFKVAPKAKNNDGKITLCKIAAMSRVQILFFFPFMLLGKHGILKTVESIDCESVKISFEDILKLNIDGNIYDISGYALFETVKDALTVCL